MSLPDDDDGFMRWLYASALGKLMTLRIKSAMRDANEAICKANDQPIPPRQNKWVELMAKLPQEEQDRIRAKSAEMNRQRAEAKRRRGK